mmetsp:Transcript_48550/g.150004  ORF Transcript_48550/g.150004 Transcript_48550/m.150004 type:complete len:193 (+) Transcript_48550:612-1190(+)
MPGRAWMAASASSAPADGSSTTTTGTAPATGSSTGTVASARTGSTTAGSASKSAGRSKLVLMGFGISNPLEVLGDGAASFGERARGGSEELVEVSQHPEEQREEMSPSREYPSRDRPSRVKSQEDDLDDFPEEHPREPPPEEEAPRTPLRLGRRRPARPPTEAGRKRRGGDTAEAGPPPFRIAGVLTDPSGC